MTDDTQHTKDQAPFEYFPKYLNIFHFSTLQSLTISLAEVRHKTDAI